MAQAGSGRRQVLGFEQGSVGSMGSPGGKPFVLFCAGEDSGDILGESLVRETMAAGLDTCGAGGARMQGAGLRPLVNFEHLPVSGFGDVLASCRTLRKDLEELRSALCSPQCLAFVAIDYPGFNMKLVRLAKRLGKPALYVAPPQIWAWKSGRAKQLREIPLAVFFDFEADAYRKFGCEPRLIQHPLASARLPVRRPDRGEVLLLPGSRRAQAARNIRAFLKTALDAACRIDAECGKVTILAARESLQVSFTEIVRNLPAQSACRVKVEVAPAGVEERLERYSQAVLALACPGTATLEVSLAGVPMVVCTKPDFLTYALGKMLVRTENFALPNLVLGKDVFEEIIVPPMMRAGIGAGANLVAACRRAVEKDMDSVAQSVQGILARGQTSRELMLEFLGKLVEGQAH